MATLPPRPHVQLTPYQQLSDYYTMLDTRLMGEDAKASNTYNSTIEAIRSIMNALENARNIFMANFKTLQEQQAIVDRFQKMIECVDKADYCRVNLMPSIEKSIHQGTNKGWYPKLFNTLPRHLVPMNTLIIEFIGRFKYATTEGYCPSLHLGGSIFVPQEKSEDTLTFKPGANQSVFNFQNERCTFIKAKLIIPYRTWTLGVTNVEFSVVLRALPIYPGKVTTVFTRTLTEEIVSKEYSPKWDEKFHFERPQDTEFKEIVYKRFDGKEKRMDKPGKISYLTLGRITDTQWFIHMVPPIDL